MRFLWRIEGGDRLIIDLKDKSFSAEIEASLKKNGITSSEILYATHPFLVEDTEEIIPTNKIVLRPLAGISLSQILKQVQRFNVEVESIDEFGYVLLRVPKQKQLTHAANAIYESGLVEFCHPDFEANIKLEQTDVHYPGQYHLNNTGQNGGLVNNDINAPEAWTFTTGENTIRVAVIDSGVADHPEFGNRLLSGYTHKNPSSNGRPKDLRIMHMEQQLQEYWVLPIILVELGE
ncbi:MAG: hypothetical protein OHK0038_24580 [Flammeovirgaceae bacterium]